MATDKQTAFINEYLIDFNATQAAIRAGYSEKTAYSQGSRLLKNVEIIEAINKRFDELTMSANEALFRLSEQAKSSMGGLITVDQFGTFSIDLSDATPAQLRAIKSVSITETDKTTNYRIELYDAQSALKEILKIRRLDEGKHDSSLKIKIEYANADDDSEDYA